MKKFIENLVLAACALAMSTVCSGYVCFPDSSTSEIFEVDGHCLNARHEAWLIEPFFLMELIPWMGSNGQPFPPEQVYGLLGDGVLQWNNHNYQNINMPGRVALEIFPNRNNASSLITDNVNSIIFSDQSFEDACNPGITTAGCTVSRGFARIITNAHGGIFQRRSSDIFLPRGPWAVPPLTPGCGAFGNTLIVTVISHEVGHALGVAHQSREGFEPFPVMDGFSCGNSPFFPVEKEKDDLDFLYGITNGINQVDILFPEDGITITWLSEFLDFIGVAVDPAGNDISSQIQWISSIQGFLGTGAQLSNVDLMPGEHLISTNIFDDDPNQVNNTDFHIYKISNDQNATANKNTQSFGSNGQTGPVVRVNIDGPILENFSIDENPCFILPGENSCIINLSWSISGFVPFGSLLILDGDGNIIGTGRNGNETVTVSEGQSEFRSVFRTSSGVDHTLGVITGLAGEISGDIFGPGICEIDPPPPNSCFIRMNLEGFARHIILYNSTTSETIFELTPNGLFSTNIQVEIPSGGSVIGLFSEAISDNTLLHSRFFDTFRNADFYEDDDFVQNVIQLEDSFNLQSIFINQAQPNHNFHNTFDIDFIRVPFPSNVGQSSLRTFNISSDLVAEIEIGCMQEVAFGWQYMPLSGSSQGFQVDGIEPGSKVHRWPTGFPPAACGGGAFIAKVFKSTQDAGEHVTYDIRMLDGLEDLYEPDDQRSDAAVILLDEIQSHDFNTDVNDWLTFSPLSSNIYEIAVVSTGPNTMPCIDAFVGNSLTQTVCADASNRDITLSFEGPDEHTFKLYNDLARVGTDYEVFVSIEDPAPGADSFEQDDTVALAMPHLNVGDAGTVPSIFSHNFADDAEDWFFPRCSCVGSAPTLISVNIDTSASGINVCTTTQPNQSQETVEAREGSTTLIADYDYIKAMPCNGSSAGPNTEYQVEVDCACIHIN